jgi:hypothetical protein
MMSNRKNINLGAAIFADIENDPYLNELYDNLLYNYSIKLFNLKNRETKPVNIEDALRFADILSKSTDKENADKHKIMAQEIVALLRTIEPEHPVVEFYLGSILSSIGNYRGMAMATPNYRYKSILDWFYAEFSKDLLSIPAEPDYQFFRSQKAVYDRLDEPYFSYSGPTSMGKSFIMRMFIKKQIMDGIASNFAILVPTKALINEVTSKIINDLKELLAEHNYRLVTSAGALALKQDHNFIFVLTPERLLYLLISNPHIEVDYLFVDEAHKISSKGPRSTFYYKVVDMLCQRFRKPHVIFASPNIPNPEVYLKLIPGAEPGFGQRLTTTFAPVSQMKYLIDFPSKKIQMFNTYSSTLATVANIRKEPTFCQLIWRIGKNAQNIIYCSGTAKAVDFAREFASDKPASDDKELLTLAQDIRNEVHGDYYLADVISKGVAYHIGYLPSTIRMRIEELFRKGLIHTMFCTSTLVEGVNLPADNLFITHYKNGRAKMTPVDFKNLIGRVGRIEYNLYGNVFLVRLDKKVKTGEYLKLLKQEVPEQKLSLVTELTGPQKQLIVENLMQGNVEFPRHPEKQSNDSYDLMRKFAIILLRDITKDNRSLVWKEFAPLLDDVAISKIREAFSNKENQLDDDINTSLDQASNLTAAIANGLKYPEIDDRGNVDYNDLMDFLETLCRIFKWEVYERSTLGFVSKDGSYGKLRWYAVILSQWIKGTGLSFIMEQTLNYKREHPETGVWINGVKNIYKDTREHRNIVISDTLKAIENVILFSISNYFLRFSSEYKRFHNVEVFPNDWYEYVEYGTINPLSITLQRNGFSRETSTYIKRNRSDYVVMMPDGEIKLRRSLADCPSASVRKEVADILYNIPELFVE